MGTVGFVLGIVVVALWILGIVLRAAGVIQYDFNYTNTF